MNKDQAANFINSSKAAGVSDDSIRTTLKLNGLSEEEINILLLQPTTVQNPEPLSVGTAQPIVENKNQKKIRLALEIIFLIAVVAYVFLGVLPAICIGLFLIMLHTCLTATWTSERRWTVVGATIITIIISIALPVVLLLAAYTGNSGGSPIVLLVIIGAIAISFFIAIIKQRINPGIVVGVCLGLFLGVGFMWFRIHSQEVQIDSLRAEFPGL